MHVFRSGPSPVILAAALLASLAGCASSGRYPVQAPVVAAVYGRGDAALNAPVQAPRSALDGAAPADVRQDAWWTGFGDPQLDRLVDQVLRVNNALAVASLNVQRARLQAGLAANAVRPQPSLSGPTYSTSRAIDRSADWQRTGDYSVGASLQWEVDLWGRLRTQRDMAVWAAQASEEDRQNTLLLAIGDAITYYWNLAYLNQSVAAGEADLAQAQRTLELVDARFSAGAASGLEVRQARQALESRRSSQSALEQRRVEVRNALTVLLDGTPWPQADEPRDLRAARSPAIGEGVPADLLARRPDLRSAELQLRNSLLAIRVTATSYYPTLSLTGGVTTRGPSLGEVLRNPVATLGAGLALPFLNLQRAQLNTDLAGTDYQIAATRFRQTLYTALSEVDDALSAREQLARQVAASQASYDEAVEIERAQEVRYRVGASSLRDWLEAQQVRRNAELTLAGVRQNQLNNDVTLFKALGGSAAAASSDVERERAANG
ncbi:efflux transporter outer membrane subunit [Xanthomonas sp. 60]